MYIRVAGPNYYRPAVARVRVGDEVKLVAEPTCKYDGNAIRIECRDQLIGYVPRFQTGDVRPHIGRPASIASIATEGMGKQLRVFIDAGDLSSAIEKDSWPLMEPTIREDADANLAQESIIRRIFGRKR